MSAVPNSKAFSDPRGELRVQDEAGLLGRILVARDCVAPYREAASIITDDHFFVRVFGGVFYEIGQAIDAGIIDSSAIIRRVKGILADNPQVIDLFGDVTVMFSAIIKNQIIPMQVEATAHQIKREWLVDSANEAWGSNDYQSVSDLTREVKAIDAGAVGQERLLNSLGSITDSALVNLNEIFQTGVIEGYAYAGLKDIESVIGGWKPGRYYVIGARPSMGKSTFGLSLLRQTASKNHGVMIVSLEMTAHELGSIALCDTALEMRERIEYRDIQSDRFLNAMPAVNQNRLEVLIEAQQRMAGLPLQICDKAGMSISEIRVMARRFAQQLEAQGRKLEVILIDHLNLIRPDDRYKGVKSVETEQISNQLKVLAKELGLAVVCLVQLNRGVEGRDDKMPSLADLRWSGAIEQDADVVMFLYRKAYYLERKREEDEIKDGGRIRELAECKNTMEVLFAKNRGGPCPVVRLWCDMATGSVRDLAK
jgi:replicative DNA helicase